MAVKDYSHIVPKPAATVLLARDGRNGAGEPAVEVFMVERHHKIDFASGAMVFPGGKVDPSDGDAALRDYCAAAEGLDDAELALRVAAVRETFEECGVLLARERDGAGDDLVPAERLVTLEPWAQRLQDDTATMRDFVEAEDLELALDQLVYFAHWVTPPLLPKRFDTHFFLVRAPSDQAAVHDGEESVASVWRVPAETTALADEGRVVLVFATRMNLTKLGGFDTVDAAIDTTKKSKVVSVQPKLVSHKEGIRKLRIPVEAGYGGDVFDVIDKPAM